MVNFIPERDIEDKIEIPYFEDASKDKHGVRGHTVKRSMIALKHDLTNAMYQLGGSITSIEKGKYETNPPRYGFIVEFNFGVSEGVIEVAALPIRRENETRKNQALKQALYMTTYALEAQYFMSLMSPGVSPSIPYLLVSG